GGSLTSSRTGINSLIEHWDGSSWTIVSSPNATDSVFDVLTGATCTSTQCWAVGFSTARVARVAVNNTLIERWDPTSNSWSITSANASVVDTALFGVTCTSDSDCVAVGASYNGKADQTLIEHWDGVLWSTFVSPNSSLTSDNDLLSVTCASSSECWAVGYYKDANGDAAAGSATVLECHRWTLWTARPDGTFGDHVHLALCLLGRRPPFGWVPLSPCPSPPLRPRRVDYHPIARHRAGGRLPLSIV